MKSKFMTKFPNVVFLLMFVLGNFASAGQARAADEFKLGVSIYVGWMPWYYMKDTGILKKWADKEGIKIEVVEMDYPASLDAFVAKQIQAVPITNMEALDMPAQAGVTTWVIITGDYSNGNDKFFVRGGLDWKTLRGTEIILCKNTVSQYMLARGLSMNGLSEKDVKLTNTSDSDIGPTFIANTGLKAVVTWNPIAMQIEQQPGVKVLFDSSKIPGEILDLLAVNVDDARFARALTGAWYETMALMQRRGPEADAAMEAMAKRGGSNLTEFKAQLKTTAMFWDAKSASDYTKGAEIKQKMDQVRKFCFEHGLLGENAANVDVVGIKYPDGTIQGDPKKVRLIFETKYMDAVANGGN